MFIVDNLENTSKRKRKSSVAPDAVCAPRLLCAVLVVIYGTVSCCADLLLAPEHLCAGLLHFPDPFPWLDVCWIFKKCIKSGVM